MINRTHCLFYEVNGTFYKDLAEAQKADLTALFDSWTGGGTREDVADWMLKNAEAISTILTTTPRSRRRKPRKDKGVPRSKSVTKAPDAV